VSAISFAEVVPFIADTSWAQQERIASSRMQAFWWGYGKGDGMEASELSQVRGEKEAVLHAMDVKHCPSASGQ